MALQRLQEADYVLSRCGRPLPPAGYRWVDLTRVIPYRRVVPAANTQFSDRVVNLANTVFLARCVFVKTGTLSFRIKWPNGHYLERNISEFNPVSPGQAAIALEPEIQIDPQGKIEIDVSATLSGEITTDTIQIYIVGALRYLLKAVGDEPPPYKLSLSHAPRVRRNADQNIMAPEWLLGDQCYPETPAGYWDEPYSQLSPSMVVAVGQMVPDFTVLFPGDADVVIRRVTFIEKQDAGVLTGFAAYNIRFPDGYSPTGGDFISSFWAGSWLPSMKISRGARAFIDMSTVDSTGVGNFTTTIRFDGVKRRKL